MALMTISRVFTLQVLLILLTSLLIAGVSADDTPPVAQSPVPDIYYTQPRFPLDGDSSDRARAIAVLLGSLFVTLLLGLLNGLILAIYSANSSWARVLIETGSERQRRQARALLNLRHYARWFLGALIISKVALAEGLPILLQTVLGSTWQPMLAASVLVALFAEVIPLYIMPQHALFWAYHCWPLVWLLMIITAPVSYVVSFLFNATIGPVTDQVLYTQEQLVAMLDFFNENGDCGGKVGPECSRVTQGALKLHRKKLLSRPYWSSNLFNLESNQDLELGIMRGPDLVVPWDIVQTVQLDDVVDTRFYERIKQAAFSRFPVVGYANDTRVTLSEDESTTLVSSEGTLPERGLRIYGYLHIRNLMGLSVDYSSKDEVLHVRDLQLDPVSVVYDDMLIYDLLHVFQSNAPHMAVVIRRPMKDELAKSPHYKDLPEGYVLKNLMTKTGPVEAYVPVPSVAKKPGWWTTSDRSPGLEQLNTPTGRDNTNVADGMLEALGIVTFTDIVDAILQKKSEPEQTVGRKWAEHGLPKKSPAKMDGSKSPFNPRDLVSMRANQTNGAFEPQRENGGLIRRRNASGRSASDELTRESTLSRRTNQNISDGLDDGTDKDGARNSTGSAATPAATSIYTDDRDCQSSRQSLEEPSTPILATPEDLIQAGTLSRAYISRMMASDDEPYEPYEPRTVSMPVMALADRTRTSLPVAPRHFSLAGTMLPRLRQVSPLVSQNNENVRPDVEDRDEAEGLLARK